MGSNLSDLFSHPASIFRRSGLLVLDLLLLGPSGSSSATLEKETSLWQKIDLQTIPEDYGAASRRVEAPFDEPLTSDLDSVKGSKMRGVQQWTKATSSWANIEGPIGVAPEVPISVTRNDGRLGKLKRNLVVQDVVDTDSERSDEIDGEEHEVTTPI
ncbi:hypothetical protein O181_002533 [Austropuccinia psidii MF-1]|uniref:Uncharacterized protein n=1 Tax=Austropuccinia psidii MF-1 TaxID=1389203 RepID=A0A9Q3GCQ5_9BASI|nr:hypothetical protein [Austropuccinia psidii MF-1]